MEDKLVPCCKNCKNDFWEQEPEHGKTEHFCKIKNNAKVDKYFCCQKHEYKEGIKNA